MHHFLYLHSDTGLLLLCRGCACVHKLWLLPELPERRGSSRLKRSEPAACRWCRVSFFAKKFGRKFPSCVPLCMFRLHNIHNYLSCAGVFTPPYSINNAGVQLPINTKVRAY